MSNDGRLYLLAATVVAVAAWVSRRNRPVRLVAALLAYGLLGDLLRRSLRLWVLVPWTEAHGDAPLRGWARVAGHLSQAVMLGWGVGILLVVAHLFYRPARPWVVAVWSLVVAAAATTYPWLRQTHLGTFYLAWTVLVVVASAAMVAVSVQRRRCPGSAHVAAVWVVAVEASLLLGPYLFGPFSAWWTAKIAYAVLYVGMLPILTWETLWKTRS